MSTLTRAMLIANGTIKPNCVHIHKGFTTRELATSNAKAVMSRRHELSIARVLVTTRRAFKVVK